MKTHLLRLLMVTLYIFFNTEAQAQEVANLAKADDALSADQSVENADVEESSKVKMSGFVDSYYQYNFNKSLLPTSFTEINNSFTLGMANLVFAKNNKKIGFMADLAVGPRAEVANGYAGSTLSAIKQLYITYIPKSAVTFTIGTFGTHVGYEVIDAPANINYSTSYMFSNGPFYHTGLKVDFDLSSNFGAMVGIYNDTDTKMDLVPGKHLAGQLSFSNKSVGIFLNYIGGADAVDDEDNSLVIGHQVDLTATYQVSDGFGLGLNATTKTNIMANSENKSWHGVAIYANYLLGPAFQIGLRGEYIGDKDGLILGAIDGSVIDLTVSGNIHIGSLTIIPEYRMDVAGKDVYLNAHGQARGFTSALILAAIYSF